MSIKQPLLVPWTDYPAEPLDLPAAQAYALITESEFPLELHGEPGECWARSKRVVGTISARRSNGGMVVFSYHFKTPAHEQMVAECMSGEATPPIMIVLGGSWPYKAVIGTAGFHVKQKELPQGTHKPMVVTLLSDELEKLAITRLNDFASGFKKTTKGITVLRYVNPGSEDAKVVNAHVALGARSLVDLDSLHLAIIQRFSNHVQKAVKGCKGQTTWVRDNAHRHITIMFQGTQQYVQRAIDALAG